jgi:hypothetical protein
MSELFLLVLKLGDFLVFDLKGRYKKMSVYVFGRIKKRKKFNNMAQKSQ